MSGFPQLLAAVAYGVGAILLIAGVVSLGQWLLARIYREPLGDGRGEAEEETASVNPNASAR